MYGERQREAALGNRMARAFGHPVRAHALIVLTQRMASPSEIAEELGETIGKVSYHFRELRDLGLIELVETDCSQGGVRHFYRARGTSILDREGMEAQSPAERAASASAVLNLMMADVAAAVQARTMDRRPERILARFQARVDEQGWRELCELYDEALLRSIEIHNESVGRLQASGEQGFSAGLHSLVFELADSEEASLEPR